LLIVSCVSTVAAQNQSPGTGSISGRVTIEGRPAAGIAVVATFSNPDPERRASLFFAGLQLTKAVTDQDGRYRLAGLGEGRYGVAPFAPDTIISGDASESDDDLGINLRDGEQIEGVDFNLARGGVITGRVSYPDGRPMIGASMTLLAAGEQAQGQGQRAFGGIEFSTDDRGVYRIYGIPAGKYKVGVGPEATSFNNVFRQTARKVTYYPGTTEDSKAGLIEVTAGAEKANIDFKVGQPVEFFSVSGRVLDAESGQPMPGVIVSCGKVFGETPSAIASSIGQPSGPQGEFRIDGLEPGRYVAYAISGLTGDSDVYSDKVQFEVNNTDVNNLRIPLRRGGTVSGQVIVDGAADSGVLSMVSQLEMFGVVDSDGTAPTFSRSRIGADGAFLLKGLSPGGVRILLNDFQGQSSFSIARIERDGVRVPNRIAVAAGEQIGGVTVVLQYANGTIRGEVAVEANALPRDARLIVSAKKTESQDTDDDAFFDDSAISRSVDVDPGGKFVIKGLLPGEYVVTLQPIFGAGRNPKSRELTQTVIVSNEVEANVSFTVTLKTGDQDR
jgi:protocatechuate 3,4-dioxygenase beta subunit